MGAEGEVGLREEVDPGEGGVIDESVLPREMVGSMGSREEAWTIAVGRKVIAAKSPVSQCSKVREPKCGYHETGVVCAPSVRHSSLLLSPIHVRLCSTVSCCAVNLLIRPVTSIFR